MKVKINYATTRPAAATRPLPIETALRNVILRGINMIFCQVIQINPRTIITNLHVRITRRPQLPPDRSEKRDPIPLPLCPTIIGTRIQDGPEIPLHSYPTQEGTRVLSKILCKAGGGANGLVGGYESTGRVRRVSQIEGEREGERGGRGEDEVGRMGAWVP